MNLKKFIIKVLDDGSPTSVKNMKWRSLRMIFHAICIAVVVAVSTLAVNNMYMKRKPEINPDEYWNHFSSYSAQKLLNEYLVFMDNDTIKVCRALVMPKQTLKRLIDGTSTSTRYGSTSIRRVFVLSRCYGKEFTLSNQKICDNFLFDSLSISLNPLWEKEKK